MNHFILTLLLILMSHLTFAMDINQLKLKNKQSILKDRAFLNFPNSAINQAKSVGIMSHDPNEEKETRIVFDNKEERLVFFAQELFSFCSTDLLKELEETKEEGYNFKYSEIFKAENITVIQAQPTEWDDTQSGILINSLIVMTKDKSLIRIDAYINPEAFKNQKENYIELTNNVFKTIKEGSRLNNRKARIEKHLIYGTKMKFEFDLPEDYIVQIDQKYDFQVFRIIKFTELSDTTWGSISIYTGNHPSFFYPDYGFDKQTEMQKTDYLSKEIEWYYYADDKRNLYLKEQIITSNNIEKGLLTHIAISSNNPLIIKELSDLVSGIKLK